MHHHSLGLLGKHKPQKGQWLSCTGKPGHCSYSLLLLFLLCGFLHLAPRAVLLSLTSHSYCCSTTSESLEPMKTWTIFRLPTSDTQYWGLQHLKIKCLVLAWWLRSKGSSAGLWGIWFSDSGHQMSFTPLGPLGFPNMELSASTW